MHTTTRIPTQRRADHDVQTPGRFVDPDDLICPGCAEHVRCAPPAWWAVRDGLPVPQFSHPDATPLCRTGAGAVADPVEAA